MKLIILLTSMTYSLTSLSSTFLENQMIDNPDKNMYQILKSHYDESYDKISMKDFNSDKKIKCVEVEETDKDTSIETAIYQLKKVIPAVEGQEAIYENGPLFPPTSKEVKPIPEKTIYKLGMYGLSFSEVQAPTIVSDQELNIKDARENGPLFPISATIRKNKNYISYKSKITYDRGYQRFSRYDYRKVFESVAAYGYCWTTRD